MLVARIGVAVLLALSSAGRTYAWGPQGHQVTGAIADRLLGANAATQVGKILGGASLEVASTWPDCAKDVEPGTFKYKPDPSYHASCGVFETTDGIGRMEDYVRRNSTNCDRGDNTDPCHKQYHYADVPVQEDHYDRTEVGTSDHDIVSAILAAVDVLQDRPARAPFSIKDKQEALLMLAHFAGDIHQPLHVGAVYLRKTKRIDPDVGDHHVDSKTETHGGNSIHDGKKNLHAEWDDISPSLKPSSISKTMIADAKAIAVTDGGVNAWPALWAGDTVRASHRAFQGLTFSQPAGAKPGVWNVDFTDRNAYAKMKSTVQYQQLVKGGARLAQLLNAIWP
jgi:hypothetical protein